MFKSKQALPGWHLQDERNTKSTADLTGSVWNQGRGEVNSLHQERANKEEGRMRNSPLLTALPRLCSMWWRVCYECIRCVHILQFAEWDTLVWENRTLLLVCCNVIYLLAQGETVLQADNDMGGRGWLREERRAAWHINIRIHFQEAPILLDDWALVWDVCSVYVLTAYFKWCLHLSQYNRVVFLFNNVLFSKAISLYGSVCS